MFPETTVSLDALRSLGMERKVKLVGFDSSQPLLQAVDDLRHRLVLGQIAVRAALQRSVDAGKGNSFPRRLKQQLTFMRSAVWRFTHDESGAA